MNFELFSTDKLSKELNKSRFLINKIVEDNNIQPIFVEGRTKLFSENQVEEIKKFAEKYISIKNLSEEFDADVSNIHRYVNESRAKCQKFGSQFYMTEEEADKARELIRFVKNQKSYMTIRNLAIATGIGLDKLTELAETKGLPFIVGRNSKYVMLKANVELMKESELLNGNNTDFEALANYIKEKGNSDE